MKITNLYLESNRGEGNLITFDERTDDPVLSFTVIKTTGRDAPMFYESRYGSLTLPFWETFQDSVGSKMIAINVIFVSYNFDENIVYSLIYIQNTIAYHMTILP